MDSQASQFILSVLSSGLYSGSAMSLFLSARITGMDASRCSSPVCWQATSILIHPLLLGRESAVVRQTVVERFPPGSQTQSASSSMP